MIAGRRGWVSIAVALALSLMSLARAQERRVVSLDGEWGIAEGSFEEIPKAFDHKIAVPGLADMAQPPFEDVGTTAGKRQAFWYRRTFRIDGAVPPVAQLKVHKAQYGTRVVLNGKMVGDHIPCFTPGYFDVRDALKGAGAENELIIRVGAHRTSLPESVPAGWDFEKRKHIPGIYDSVELILTGAPQIVNIQTVPDLPTSAVRAAIALNNAEPNGTKGMLVAEVREAATGRVAAKAEPAAYDLAPGQSGVIDLRIPLGRFRHWSPEDPFLYELAVRTGGDARTVRFGMREIHFDRASGRAILNGRPYILRGTNVTLYRFFEDPERGDKPWRKAWVRTLHERFKGMQWNSIRYCIGLAPEFWYDLCDEMGILIQDEFPIWHLTSWPPALKADEIASQYREWMQERWNHPCVMIWDGQNESVTTETGKAIAAVRNLDLSNRNWENGWSEAQAPDDPVEVHPYHFQNQDFRLPDIAGLWPVPNVAFRQSKGHPLIINEYGWLWLNRDGTPTTLTRKYYDAVLGPDATAEQRFYHYARLMAAETEFWRTGRACAGVLHFCGLGYSRPDGQTSDHFGDLENLKFEKYFDEFVRESFNPVGLMIDSWAFDLPANETREIPVVLINDLYEPWRGKVRLQIVPHDGWTLYPTPDQNERRGPTVRKGSTAFDESQECALDPLGKTSLRFQVKAPEKPGDYWLIASLDHNGKTVRSLRDFAVLTPEQKQAQVGLTVGRPAKASSSATVDGVAYPAENAFDGKTSTRWSSQFGVDPQWIAVDLGEPREISRVEIVWEPAFARAYTIEVSDDGQAWREVFRESKGNGGTDRIRFAPTQARWLRLTGARRATQYGYSIWEIRVFP
jgi:hypothetical protein